MLYLCKNYYIYYTLSQAKSKYFCVYFSILCQMMDWKEGSLFCHDDSVHFAERSIRKEDLWGAI